MKFIKKLTEYTAYVSQCTNAIAKAVEALSANWPSDNPFKRPPGVDGQKAGLASGDSKK